LFCLAGAVPVFGRPAEGPSGQVFDLGRLRGRKRRQLPSCPTLLLSCLIHLRDSYSLGAEHLRRERPRTMGSIFWQLNDCWPVASWSSIDSFGRWKALQFYARRFYTPILVSPHVEDGDLAVYVVSDRTESRSGTLLLQHLGFDGKVFSSRSQQVDVPALASTVVFKTHLTELAQEGGNGLDQGFVVATLTIPQEQIYRNVTYLVPTKQIKLPTANITSAVTREGDGVLVKLGSDKLARSVRLTSGNETAVFEDNYFDLLPGETRTVHVKTSEAPDAFAKTLEVRSLVDAFPKTASK